VIKAVQYYREERRRKLHYYSVSLNFEL